MKILLIIVLITVIMVVAKSFCKYYYDRYEFYNNMLNFVNNVNINIAFQKNKIGEILDKINAKGKYIEFVKEYKNYIELDKPCKLENITILNEEEKLYIIDLIYHLGRSDIESEMKQIKIHQKIFEDKLLQAKVEKEKKVPLILKLAFMFGLLLSILFL